jgi:hypothetical protein
MCKIGFGKEIVNRLRKNGYSAEYYHLDVDNEIEVRDVMDKVARQVVDLFMVSVQSHRLRLGEGSSALVT